MGLNVKKLSIFNRRDNQKYKYEYDDEDGYDDIDNIDDVETDYQFNGLDDRYEKLRVENETLNEQIRDQQQQILNLISQRDSLQSKSESSSYLKEIEELKKNIESLKAHNDFNSQYEDEYQEQLKILHEKNKKQQEAIDSLKDELVQSEIALNNSKLDSKSIEELTNDNEELNRKLTITTEKLEQKKLLIKEKDTEFIENRKKIDSLMEKVKDLNELKEYNNQLVRSLEEMKTNVDKLSEQNSVLNKKNIELERFDKENKELKNQIKQMESKVGSLLLSTKVQCEEMVEQAQGVANKILKEAETDANNLLENAKKNSEEVTKRAKVEAIITEKESNEKLQSILNKAQTISDQLNIMRSNVNKVYSEVDNNVNSLHELVELNDGEKNE